MRCKGPARAIDTVALQSDVKQLDNKAQLLSRVSRICMGRMRLRAAGQQQPNEHGAFCVVCITCFPCGVNTCKAWVGAKLLGAEQGWAEVKTCYPVAKLRVSEDGKMLLVAEYKRCSNKETAERRRAICANALHSKLLPQDVFKFDRGVTDAHAHTQKIRSSTVSQAQDSARDGDSSEYGMESEDCSCTRHCSQLALKHIAEAAQPNAKPRFR